MKKTQAVKFWKAVNDSTNVERAISDFEYKNGYGGRRTLVRYVQAQNGFRQRLSTKIISKKTGWGGKYVDKLREWWEEKYPSPRKQSYSSVSSTKPNDKENVKDMAAIIDELKALNVADTQIDATIILYELREKLATGLSEYDVPVDDRPILAQLCILEIVEMEQRRRSSGPHTYDESLWILTNLGKRIIQYLDREK